MPTPEFEKVVLDNGLTLVSERYPHVRSVCLGVWVKVGSAQETPSQNGVSHFIEHMVFKGTQKRDALMLATVLESKGGDLNAFTDREVTCYHATVLNEHIELALDVLSDLVLHPVFDKAQMERERKVLYRELSMVEDSPDDWISDIFFKSVWRDHPLGQPIIGSRKTIHGISRSLLLKFYEQHYRADNMILSVAGNFEFAELRRLVDHYFTFPARQKLLPLMAPPAKYRPRSRVVAMPVDQTHLLVGFEGLGFRSSQRFDALILSYFLGGGMSSRLFQEIREKAALAYSVECDFVPFTDSGVFTVYLATAAKSVKSCLGIIGREIGRLKDTPLTESELDLVKGQLKGTILLSADQMETRQESLGRNEIVFGRHIPVEEVIAEIEEVTPDRVQRLARELFLKEKQAVVTLGRARPRLQSLHVL